MRWISPLAALSAVIFVSSCATSPKGLGYLPSTRTHKAANKPDLPAQPIRASAPTEPEDHAREAVEYFLSQRIPEGGDATTLNQRYQTAQEQLRTARRYSIATGRYVDPPDPSINRANTVEPRAALGSWQRIGPDNVGGRTRSLAIDPKNPATMFAGSATGGIWKTTDGGQTWTPLSNFLPTIAIGALVMDPTNSSTLYAGTGEWYTSAQGTGIYKSTDGGGTWVPLNAATNTNFWYVNKLVISPNNPQTVYAATWSGVWLSLDGGATWKQSLSTKNAYYGCMDLAIRPDQTTDYLFASCSGVQSNGDYQIFRNKDVTGAGTWDMVQTTTSMGRTSLAIAPSQPATIYAMATSTAAPYSSGLLAVFRSTANGDSGTWTTQVSNTNTNKLNTSLLSRPEDVYGCSGPADYSGQGDYDNVIAVDPLDPNVVWAGGIDVFRSDDGGATWGVAMYWQAAAPYASHADNHSIVFHPGYDGKTNQTIFFTNDGGVWKTDNAKAATTLGGASVQCGTLTTAVHWISLNPGYATTQFYFGTVYPGGAAYFGGTQDNGNLRGTDAGGAAKWTRLRGGDGGQVAVDPVDLSTLYFEYTNFSFSKSTDGGDSYSILTNGITERLGNFNFISDFKLDPNNSLRIYSGATILWRTEDGGNNWTAASTALVADKVSRIAVAPGDSSHVVFGTNVGRIYYNTDALNATGSTSWANTRPRSGTVSSITFDPADSNVVYLTYSSYKVLPTDAHVYKSSDGGATWNAMDGSGGAVLQDVPVNSLAVDPLNSLNLYLGTDLGVYASIDGGYTWSHDDNSFGNAVITSLIIDRTAGTSRLYAFTYGSGVWRVTLPNSGAPCTYSITPTTIQANGAGGIVSTSVNTSAGCAWSSFPAATDTFAAIAFPQSPASGVGPGTAFFNVTPNNSNTARSQTFYVQGVPVTISQSAPSFPSGNDDILGAVAIGATPYGANQDSRTFTAAASDPIHSCTKSADFNTGWYKITAPSDGTLLVSVVSERYDTFGTAGQVLSAYPASGSGVGSELACSVVARNTTSWTPSRIQFPVKSGVAYFIEVSATTQNGGGYVVLSVTMPSIPALSINPPSPTITAGSRVTLAAAVTNNTNTALRWTVVPPIGTISQAGVYTAPAVLTASQTVTVTATSLANSSVQASSVITINPSGIVFAAGSTTNAATFRTGGVAPGELITIFGSGMGPAVPVGPLLTPDNTKFLTSAGGATVLFDGVESPIVSAQASQFSVLVPYSVAGKASAQMQIKYNGVTSPAITVPVVRAAPGLFTSPSVGSGQAAMLNQDNSVNSASNPAPAGSVVVLFGTGEGQTNPPGVDGAVSISTFPSISQNVTVTVGGVNAQVLYSGEAPFLVAGVFQINVMVPPSIKPSSSVPVIVTIGGVSSRSDVTMAVK